MFESIYSILGVPFGYILRFIYEFVDNYAVAIVILTFLARLILVPSSISQQKSTAKTMRLQPKLRRIQEKYAGNQQKIQEETQALYQREGQSPFNMGCLPMLIQFPVMFGLIGVIYYPLSNFLMVDDSFIAILKEGLATLAVTSTKNARLEELMIIQNIDAIYAVVGDKIPESVYSLIKSVNFDFFGLFSLGDVPWGSPIGAIWAIPVLSFISSLASGVFSMLKQKQSNPAMAKNPSMGCMTFGMPLFSLYFVLNFPAGVGIYWIASSVFSLLTLVILNYTHSPKKMISKLMIEETIQRRSRENNLKRVAANKNRDSK